MTTSDLSGFGGLLLSLYRLVASVPLDGFQDAALSLVRQAVPFDSAIWGTATVAEDGVDIHLAHLHRSSVEVLELSEAPSDQVAFANQLMAKSLRHEGFPSLGWLGKDGKNDDEVLLEGGGSRSFFATQEFDPRTRLLHCISLHRADESALYTPQERRIVEALRPHLFQAQALNRARHLERLAAPLSGSRHGLAIADLRGVIYEADPLFKTLLSEEWPDWQEAMVPKPLVDELLQGKAVYVGRTLVVQSHEEHGLRFLQARLRCRADSLTGRERDISMRVARGQTHKEIAQDLARSPATVRNQIQTIYAKLQVDSIAGLIEAIRPLQ